MKVALVHDWLNQMGGAERVLLKLSGLYPGAPVYTSIYARDLVSEEIGVLDVRTTFMQRLPGVLQRHRWYLPVYALAFDQLRLSGFDVVISNASAFCKGVRSTATTLHICYCLTPTRFAWNPTEYLAREAVPGAVRLVLAPLLGTLRRWDWRMARRVHRFVAISKTVAERIRRYYGRDSEIIHPPVETAAFAPAAEVGDHFLVVSRLAPYKRIDLAVGACSRLGLKLKVVGSGRDLRALQEMAGSTVEFLGRLDDSAVRHQLARCRALIFPGEEDFGIVPLEAQASGRPVIAFGAGGALETVIPGETGEIFTEASVDCLAAALKQFDESRYAPDRMLASARRFDESVFMAKLRRFVEAAHEEHLGRLRREALTRA